MEKDNAFIYSQYAIIATCKSYLYSSTINIIPFTESTVSLSSISKSLLLHPQQLFFGKTTVIKFTTSLFPSLSSLKSALRSLAPEKDITVAIYLQTLLVLPGNLKHTGNILRKAQLL